MLLVIDTSTAACTAALFDEAGACLASRDEMIGRGHAERLMPMVADMMAGRQASHVIVGVGPGSFTGIRVGIAAAHGLAIGWDAKVSGLSSLALLAAGVEADGIVTAVMDGGHGELFVQSFNGRTLRPASDLLNLLPSAAAAATDADLIVGPAAQKLVDARGWGTAVPGWPMAENLTRLPDALRTLPSKPIYGRAPDAKAKAA